MAFIKKASLKIENPEVSIDSWVGNRGSIRTAANRVVEYKKIISDFNPDDYLLTHCTIVASVDVEEAPKEVHFGSDKTKKEFPEVKGKKDYFISPDTSKYMNANGDAWARELLKVSYKSFIGAENYLEHVQDPTLSKGKILDAVIREVDDGKSLFVDILVATNKKHKDLVDKIKTGKLTTLSMGSVVAFTICTQCGRVATDETELCTHIKFFKRNTFISEHDSKKRVIAELCGHVVYPNSNKFIEGSWVETPAFKGAVMRNEVEVASVDKAAFIEKYEPIVNFKSEELRHTASRVMAAFAVVDRVTDTLNKKAKTEVEEDKEIPEEDTIEEKKEKFDPVEMKDPSLPEGEEAPIDTPNLDEVEVKPEAPVKKEPLEDEKPVEETSDKDPTEEPNLEEDKTEPLPEDIKEMEKEEAPVEEELPVEDTKIEEESKKPYNELKEEIKKTLKDQIKKELLQDLGIELGTPMNQGLDNVNLNDSIIQSKLKNEYANIRKACEIVKKCGLRSLYEIGYNKTAVLKIAMLSNRYSINKDVFKIIDSLNIKDYPTFRRIAKAIESKLGKELSIEERLNLKKLIIDIF